MEIRNDLMYPGISIVIPSWNGLELLRENLPSVALAAEHYVRQTRSSTEIVVVDDGSTDATPQQLCREFPQIRLVARNQNGGFAAACNSGFEKCSLPLIALLNNDVRVEPEYLLHASRHFAQESVFAVTARVYEWEPPIFATGGRYGRFRRGFWSVYFNYDTDGAKQTDWIEERRLLSFYAIGGFAFYDRLKLQELGGFNELLSPFHWEDVDLSYRGWKRGWEIHYEPHSVAYHRISATINAHYKKRSVKTVSFRNRLLFHWINLHSRRLLASHILMLVILFMTRAFALDFGFYRSLYQALQRLPAARLLRRHEREQARRSDAEIISLLSSFYKSAPIRIYFDQAQIEREHAGIRPRKAGV